MLHYQCWAMVVTLLTRSHRSWNLSEDIRFGRISSFLLYPFAFWKYHFAEFLAFQSLQLVSVVLSVLVLAISDLITPPPVDILLRGILVSALVGVLWYSIEFTMGLLAFWLEEVWVIRVTVQLCAALLSGAFIPLELFPMAIRKAVEFTPFPLLTSIPVKIFMGQETGELAELVALTLLWTTVFGISAALVWRKGTRMYTAAGI